MWRPSARLSLLLLAATWGCVAAQPAPADRGMHEAAILERVLRYQLEAFADDVGGRADVPVCLGVGDGQAVQDPDPDLMGRLGDTDSVVPQSACDAQSSPSLVAGPIEWLQDDEVRVKGEHRKPGQGRTPLVYRVVLEPDGWVCLGPILSWDPL